MKFVNNIGDIYSIRKNRTGGWVMTCTSASDGRTEEVHWLEHAALPFKDGGRDVDP